MHDPNDAPVHNGIEEQENEETSNSNEEQIVENDRQTSQEQPPATPIASPVDQISFHENVGHDNLAYIHENTTDDNYRQIPLPLVEPLSEENGDTNERPSLASARDSTSTATPTIYIVSNRPSASSAARQRERSRVERENVSCCQFYRENMFGQLTGGIIISLIFFTAGIIMLIFSETVAPYYGIILIVTGLIPFYFTVQRWRSNNAMVIQQRELRDRREMILQLHREGREANERFPDLPPSYNFIGANDTRVEQPQPTVDELPSYEDAVKSSSPAIITVS